MSDKKKIEAAIQLILELGCFDGAHHKQWVLDQLLRILADDYDSLMVEYKDGEDGPDTYEWDEGIAP